MNTMRSDLQEAGTTTGPGVAAELAEELFMLCRGLAHSSLAMLSTVRTVVQLPGDEAHERALRQVCGEIAETFGVESSVHWADSTWMVSFSRPTEDEPASLKAASGRDSRHLSLLARLDRLREALWPPPAGSAGELRGGR
jgi:hypothetical protein